MDKDESRGRKSELVEPNEETDDSTEMMPDAEPDAPTDAESIGAVSPREEVPRKDRTVRPPGSSSDLREAIPIQLIDEDPATADFFSGPVPRTKSLLQDMAFRDVCNVGDFACAVGDRGVVCLSRDAGVSWSTQAVALDCQLTSVCFLTDRVGWIGGYMKSRRNDNPQGVLLETRDGGESWKRLIGPLSISGSTSITAGNLPGLIHLEYFGLDEAVAVTMSATHHGSKRIFQSQDGGLTWTAVNADEASEEWLGADFVSVSEGVIGGARECYAAVVANQAVVINAPQQTLRGIRGASLDSTGIGWLVGDGATILTTENAGVTWKKPDGDRPEDFSKLSDLHTVAHHDHVIVAAGSPGCCMLRSDDAGRSWHLVPTPATGLIHRVRIQPNGVSLAVGSFGQILRSTDCGMTWESVRSAQRRSGLLNLTANSSDIAWNLLARIAAEDGVRATVVQMSQPLEQRPESICEQWNHSSHGAIAALGLCDGSSDWMFARTQPEANRSAMTLVQEWDRQTDGNLRELLPLRLARQLRMWQPSVVVIEPSENAGHHEDAVASILRDALPRAIDLAADDQNELFRQVYLPPWSVSRVVIRTDRDTASEIRYSETDLLPRLKTTSGLLIDYARWNRSSFADTSSSVADESCYQISFDREELTAAKHLFDGIMETLDSASRRVIPSLDRDHSKKLQQIVTSAKLESSSLAGNMAMVGGDGTLIAQLESVGEALPGPLALRQLHELADLNLEKNNMEGYLAVQQEIIRRFPDEPEAKKAAAVLLMFYSSAETRRYRMQGQMSASISTRSKPGEPPVVPQMTGPFQSNSADHLDALQQRWDENAATAFRILSQRSTIQSTGRTEDDLSQELPPEVLLRQAVNFRNQSLSSDHSTMLSEVSRLSEPFATFARVEMQITHGAAVPEIPVFNVPRRKEQPFLDGKLTDVIWEAAEEIRLHDVTGRASNGNSESETELSSLVMLGSDEEHLYVAGIFSLDPSANRRITLATHRSHDADHGDKDRFELEIDTDRDYSTAFRFTIDESGLTSDRCWMLDRWNPQWYVDAKRDEKSWRFEAAIPLRELATQQPRLGSVWAIRLRRIQPGHHRHELVSTQGPLTDGTGLIRFIRPRAVTQSSKDE